MHFLPWRPRTHSSSISPSFTWLDTISFSHSDHFKICEFIIFHSSFTALISSKFAFGMTTFISFFLSFSGLTGLFSTSLNSICHFLLLSIVLPPFLCFAMFHCPRHVSSVPARLKVLNVLSLFLTHTHTCVCVYVCAPM